MESIWKDNVSKIRFLQLEDNKNTDVLIIGGGIAGILCAHKLKNAGIDCMLLEATEICGGITKNTTAKITIAHSLIYDKTAKRFGIEKARLYAESGMKALEEYKKIAKNIECDYETKDSYVYTLSGIEKIKREVGTFERIGVAAEFSDAAELPFKVNGALCIREQAQFNPLKFLYGIASDLPIYEHTKALEFKPHKIITKRGEINFKKLIITTHFPIFNKHGLYPLKLYQHRSYVVALQNAQKLSGMYVDESDYGLSFRSYGDLLLLGGGAHRTGKMGGGWQELEKFAKKYYPNSVIVAKWAAQDCMTLDRIAYIGRYSNSTPDVLVATGFNKWGMTTAMTAADILTDIVSGKKNKYSELFSPSRTIFRPQLAVNLFETAKGLLTPGKPRCRHLGCALKYNPVEHSWDCSCHGSRFSDKGELIDNPATDDHPDIK